MHNTRRHAALCRAAAVICREALKMCGMCAARLAAMPWLSKWAKMLQNGGISPCQTDYKLLRCTTIFIFNFIGFLCHQSSREDHRFLNCMSWSLDSSENVCHHLVIKTCIASRYLARLIDWLIDWLIGMFNVSLKQLHILLECSELSYLPKLVFTGLFKFAICV